MAKMHKRIAMLLAGSALSTVCYALTIRASLGLGPLFVLQDGLARVIGVAIGTAVIITGFGFLALALCLRSWPGAGTLLLPILGGVSLNALLPHTPSLPGWFLRVVAVVVATWMMALGGAMMIRASIGVSAYDAVMLGLHRILGRPLARIRLAMECTVLCIGWLLGGAVGVGTVMTGLLIGPGIQFWLHGFGSRPSPQVPSSWSGPINRRGLFSRRRANPPGPRGSARRLRPPRDSPWGASSLKRPRPFTEIPFNPQRCQQEEGLRHSLPPHRRPLPFVGAAPESGKALVGHGEGEAFAADWTGPAGVTLPFWVFATGLTHPHVGWQAPAGCTELPVGAIEKSRLHYTSS
jgi:uncharacterized membrane protein YczE